jgi:transcriptional regulator with XRE-family HTH domain
MRKAKENYRIPRDYVAVGEYLQELRIKAELTQRQVSISLGYSSAQFISNFERGITIPPLKKLPALQRIYKIDSNHLIELILAAERKVMAKELGYRPLRPKTPRKAGESIGSTHALP